MRLWFFFSSPATFLEIMVVVFIIQESGIISETVARPTVTTMKVVTIQSCRETTLVSRVP